MNGKGRVPRYAVRLFVLSVSAGTIFFGGLRLFIPEERKGRIYTFMIFNYLRLAQDIRPTVILEINNWRSYGKPIYRRSAL